mmetsp:Transcript_15474/g.23605  ORF Transcript_15474/g.23605 Transcript_15474/m.23605 type:complete len:550 (+) Transcript_15474:156-1805(+)
MSTTISIENKIIPTAQLNLGTETETNTPGTGNAVTFTASNLTASINVVNVTSGITAQTEQPSSTVPHPSSTMSTEFKVPSITENSQSKPTTLPNPKQVLPKLVGNAPAPKSSSKKKKNTPTVTMATTSAPQSSGVGNQGENTGRWTAEEHRLFLQGLEQHGKGWKKIASLIKSRTVVQIRTHAQKYFQKLAKARQNGEEGDVTMEGRGGVSATAATSAAGVGHPSSKRRRPNSGTKRKVLSSIVSSAVREGKRMAAAQAETGKPVPAPPLPAISSVLAPYLPPPQPEPVTTATPSSTVPSITTSHGSFPASALEDSLFRFLTPPPVLPMGATADPLQPQVNEVARQAGANPIILPSDKPTSNYAGGEESPTGVTDLIMPSWTDVKDIPAWYAKGADVDELLNEADALDWLEEAEELSNDYAATSSSDGQKIQPKPVLPTDVGSLCAAIEPEQDDPSKSELAKVVNEGKLATDVSSLPPLPSLFGSTNSLPVPKKPKVDSMINIGQALEEVTSAATDDLAVFDSHFDDQAFVSALLETNGESSVSLSNIA